MVLKLKYRFVEWLREGQSGVFSEVSLPKNEPQPDISP
jgi:hypothetical protein